MAQSLTEAEILDWLHAVERGEVTLAPQKFPQEVHSGEVPYLASNGFKLTLFVLGNAWDYPERLEAPDGRSATWQQMQQMPALATYEPPADLAWKRYGVPGWCDFRCVRCEKYVMRFSEFVRDSGGTPVCKACAAG